MKSTSCITMYSAFLCIIFLVPTILSSPHHHRNKDLHTHSISSSSSHASVYSSSSVISFPVPNRPSHHSSPTYEVPESGEDEDDAEYEEEDNVVLSPTGAIRRVPSPAVNSNPDHSRIPEIERFLRKPDQGRGGYDGGDNDRSAKNRILGQLSDHIGQQNKESWSSLLQSEIKCPEARNKCAFRMGCGTALQSYMVECTDLISGRTNQCQPACERALIALTSTEEGQDLIGCDCDGNSFCDLNKKRIEVCRDSVTAATSNETIVSCSIAQTICNADSQCSTALDFYYTRCRSVFKGRPCTKLCKNSLDILNRQVKAQKLKTCFCEGDEDFACQDIKETTDTLCSDEMLNRLDLLAAMEAVTNASSRIPGITSMMATILTATLTMQFLLTGWGW